MLSSFVIVLACRAEASEAVLVIDCSAAAGLVSLAAMTKVGWPPVDRALRRAMQFGGEASLVCHRAAERPIHLADL